MFQVIEYSENELFSLKIKYPTVLDFNQTLFNNTNALFY